MEHYASPFLYLYLILPEDDNIFTGISVALLITGKIIWDFFTGGNQSSAEIIGIPVANDAHLYGFIGSLIITIFLIINWHLKE